MELIRYDTDWFRGFTRDPDGRFIKFEPASEALGLAVELLTAAGQRPAAAELREAAQRLERVAHSAFYDEDYGWSVAVDADPEGEYTSAREVARLLRAAAQQLSRCGHWSSADRLLQLVGQLGPRGE